VNKGARGMPRLLEAMKDAVSCDKPRGDAHSLRSGGFRMGQPDYLKDSHPQGSQPAELKHLSKQRKRKQ